MDVETHPQNGNDPTPTPADPRRVVPLVDGDRTVYLVESMNAYCVVEETMHARISELVFEAANGSMRAIRALLWAQLQARHGDEFPTHEHVGLLVDRVGLEAIWQQLAGVTLTSATVPESRQVRRARVRKAAH